MFWPADLRVPIVFGGVIVAMSCSLPSPVQKILPHFTGTRARCSVARQDVTCKHEIEQDGIGLKIWGQANNSKYFSKRCGNRPISIL
jgi:hypothetical protein